MRLESGSREPGHYLGLGCDVDTVGLLMTVIAPGRISRSRLEKIKLLNYESGAVLDSYNTARSVTLLTSGLFPRYIDM